MLIDVRYLENLRIEALFDDFNVVSDQPIRYKGDGTAPGPFDYFLASSVLCAAYFVKVYCKTRDISMDGITLRQQNIISPENRYKQSFHIEIELPDTISEKDKEGILKAMDRCTVKRVIQNEIDFIIEEKKKSQHLIELENNHTQILSKDCSAEETIEKLTSKLTELGIEIEIASWRNPLPHVWSVHIRDAHSPLCYTNGKGATKKAALCSALGEYFERLSNNYFYNDYYLPLENPPYFHYKNEKWFQRTENKIPDGLLDEYLLEIYDPENELSFEHLLDHNSDRDEICALPYTRQSDGKIVYIPVNILGNLYVSNGMSAGNTKYEARVQALSEIFERAVKNQVIANELTLPDIPKEVLNRYPHIVEGINKLEEKGFKIYAKDSSLGGKYPVLCVALLNPLTSGVFLSFGSHPCFEVALERSLTELMQGRSFEGMNDLPKGCFNSFAISEQTNLIEHFIDSTGAVSWTFFKETSEFEFCDWNFKGTTKEEFDYCIKALDKECYIMDHDHLGVSACRIIVPGFSEIYPIEDLIYDNSNKSRIWRKRILSLHSLNDDELENLLLDLKESGLGEYTEIAELIGVAFDDNTPWANLTLTELKCLINLKLGDFEAAKEQSDLLLNFSDNTPERNKFFQAVHMGVEIVLNDEDFNQYQDLFFHLFGEELTNNVYASIWGNESFYGLIPIEKNLKNINKHQKLLQSYKII